MIEYFHWDSVFAMVSMEIDIDICRYWAENWENKPNQNYDC